jgi:hypothetical protein
VSLFGAMAAIPVRRETVLDHCATVALLLADIQVQRDTSGGEATHQVFVSWNRRMLSAYS